MLQFLKGMKQNSWNEMKNHINAGLLILTKSGYWKDQRKIISGRWEIPGLAVLVLKYMLISGKKMRERRFLVIN